MIWSLPGKATVILAASGLAAGGLAGAAAAGPAHAFTNSGWQMVATIAPDNQEVQLNAVTAIARGDAWAVGVAGTADSAIVVRWNGTAWRQAAVPAALAAKASVVNSVAATSDSNVWAFDFGGNWLHFDGSSWTAGRVPALRGGQHGLGMAASVAVAKHGAWVFGFDSTAAKLISYAAHFNGSTWRAMSLPGPVGQFGVSDASAVSAKDIWAVVGGGPGRGTANGLLHWDGRRWRSAVLPSFLAHKTNLASVLALPGGHVWVAGGIPSGVGHARGVTALWNGHTWTVDKLAADRAAPDDVIGDLVPDGNGGVWAMGFTPRACAGPMWHFSAGAWSDTGLVGCLVGAYVHGPQGPGQRARHHLGLGGRRTERRQRSQRRGRPGAAVRVTAVAGRRPQSLPSGRYQRCGAIRCLIDGGPQEPGS